jgi:hypothetical protein
MGDDELRRLLDRLAGLEARVSALTAARDRAGRSKAYLGKVYNAGAMPSAVPYYYATHPATIAFDEQEGAVPTFTVDTSLQVVLGVLGHVPAVDDYLLAKADGPRWIAERGSTGGPPPPPPPPPPPATAGCSCGSGVVPATLTMSNSGPCLSSDFLSCNITWQATPSVFSGLALGSWCYLSNEMFADPFTGRTFEYNLSCDTVFWRLSRVYYPTTYAPASQDGVTYTWRIGDPGNTCSPFLLTGGTIYPGGDGECIVTISPASGRPRRRKARPKPRLVRTTNYPPLAPYLVNDDGSITYGAYTIPAGARQADDAWRIYEGDPKWPFLYVATYSGEAGLCSVYPDWATAVGIDCSDPAPAPVYPYTTSWTTA